MRVLALVVLALPVASACFAESAATNAVPGVKSAVVVTNAPASKSTSAEGPEAKLPRRQCEAITKSGNRCKRNSAPDGKLCRQHQRIRDRK